MLLCCVNKTHWFSLLAQATHEYNCRFCIVKGKFSCFYNLGFNFRVLAATLYDNILPSK